jgi:hypothetical protein
MPINDGSARRGKAQAFGEEGIVSPEDFVIPIGAAALFTIVGYCIINADREHADDISQILWVVLCCCSAMAILASLAEIGPRAPSGSGRTSRIVSGAAGSGNAGKVLTSEMPSGID